MYCFFDSITDICIDFSHRDFMEEFLLDGYPGGLYNLPEEYNPINKTAKELFPFCVRVKETKQ